MLVSTQTEHLAAKFSHETAIRMLADAGYEAFDLSLFCMLNDDDPFNSDRYLELARRLCGVAEVGFLQEMR